MCEIQKQTQLVFYNRSVEGAKQDGYPTFNNCNHYIVDMSHLDPKTDDWMNTISIKLPNGNFVTFCVMQTGDNEACIDAQFHGEKIEEHMLLGFRKGESTEVISNKNIYALLAHSKN